MSPGKQNEPMPKWERSPDELVAAFATYVASIPDAESRKMFGYPAAFVNGQMFAGLFGPEMILRLSESDRAAFVAQTGASAFEPMPGRPMREYVVVPEAVRMSPALDHWLEWSARYARSLPPKQKAGGKRGTAKTSAAKKEKAAKKGTTKRAVAKKAARKRSR